VEQQISTDEGLVQFLSHCRQRRSGRHGSYQVLSESDLGNLIDTKFAKSRLNEIVQKGVLPPDELALAKELLVLFGP
jgi:hypothetical protein